MLILQPITPAIATPFKAIRLRALLDTPTAFRSTYSKEVQLTDSEWQERAANWNGHHAIGYLAIGNREACGIVGCLLDSSDLSTAYLVSMWVAPTHRNYGVGKQLVNAVINWAQAKHVQTLYLMVTSNNQVAMRFYHSLGFVKTGKTEPYPNDDKLIEYEMARYLE